MKDLIERLEKATEGSRELDAEITVVCDMRPQWLAKTDGEMWVSARTNGLPPDIMWKDARMKRGSGNPTAWYSWKYITTANVYPSFTTSLDAALTLVPVGYSLKLYSHPAEHGHHADVYLLRDGILKEKDLYEAECAGSPALAICIAALQSRARRED